MATSAQSFTDDTIDGAILPRINGANVYKAKHQMTCREHDKHLQQLRLAALHNGKLNTYRVHPCHQLAKEQQSS